VSFCVFIKQKSTEAINVLPGKTRRIIFDALKGLEKNPWPGASGDKEKLRPEEKTDIYRLHIGRSYTAFYTIDTRDHVIRIHDVMTIEQAHKKYGRM